jgi:hypothetical protein
MGICLFFRASAERRLAGPAGALAQQNAAKKKLEVPQSYFVPCLYARIFSTPGGRNTPYGLFCKLLIVRFLLKNTVEKGG